MTVLPSRRLRLGAALAGDAPVARRTLLGAGLAAVAIVAYALALLLLPPGAAGLDSGSLGPYSDPPETSVVR
jgi:hypothetical protein